MVGGTGTWAAESHIGAVGGGILGGNGIINNGGTIAGATQETGYSFGQGATGRNGTSGSNNGGEGAGGGGGGYYGGYAQTATGNFTNASGAGGSGYINPILTNASTTAGTGGTTNGYAKITKYKVGYQYLSNSSKPSIIITATLTSNNIYNITINISDEDSLNYSKCKYVLTQSNVSLGTNISNYTDGTLSKDNTTLHVGICGNYYMHVIATDTVGNISTKVSKLILGNNVSYSSGENSTTYSYMNNVQNATLEKGIYRLEVWGGAGGHSKNSSGTSLDMQGGYSVGILSLANSQDIFIVTGGQGGTTTSTTGGAGGYNGGGNGGNGAAGYCGGGGRWRCYTYCYIDWNII